MNRYITITVGFLLSMRVFCVETPEKTLRESYLMSKAPHVTIAVDMTIQARNGIKSRSLKVYIKHEEGIKKLLMHIVAPAFLQKMKFLVHQYEAGVENKWLRTSRGVRRLSAAQRSDRLFDSDFSVEDFSEIEVSDYALNRLEPQNIDGHGCEVIEMIPHRAGGEYQKKVVKIDNRSGIIRQVEFFDSEGELSKLYTLHETQTHGPHIVPLSCSMETVSRGTRTILSFKQIDINSHISDSVFNKGNL